MTEVTKPKDVWLVVGNGMNWGKGRSLLSAFLNAMKHDSRTYPTTVLHVRKITPPADWHERQNPNRGLGFKLTDDDFYALVSVDGMGAAEWPSEATVQKLDIGGSKTNEASEPLPLREEVRRMLKAYHAFHDEWTSVVCTEEMDEAFGGDATDDDF